MGVEANLEGLRGIEDVEAIRVFREDGALLATIPNEQGRRTSLQIYANLVGFEDGTIDAMLASEGLDRFGTRYVDEVRAGTNHPNVARLLDVVSSGRPIKVAVDYNLPSGLKEKVEGFYEISGRSAIRDVPNTFDTFHEVINLLERGHLKAAHFMGNEQVMGDLWKVNDWVRQAILLGPYIGVALSHCSLNDQSDYRFLDMTSSLP